MTRRVLLILCLLCSCSPAPVPPPDPDLRLLQQRMTEAFASLELYALDHDQVYPDDWTKLVPHYLQAVPRDPRSNLPLLYEKTASGYLLKAWADYKDCGAAAGFPQMDQDGFFALQSEDFPGSEPLP